MRHIHCVHMLRTAGGSTINPTSFRASPYMHVKSQASGAKDAFILVPNIV